jgi:hypothetical protein
MLVLKKIHLKLSLHVFTKFEETIFKKGLNFGVAILHSNMELARAVE